MTPTAAAPLYLLRRPAAREEVAVVVAVEGDVEDVGVAVEGLLGPVPVVDVLRGTGSVRDPPRCATGSPSPGGVPIPLPGGALPSPR